MAEDRKEKHNRVWFPLLLVGLCVVFEYFSSKYLPTQEAQKALKLQGARTQTDLPFVLSNARNNLVELTGFGPRVIGSEVNEVVIPHYLLEKLRHIQAQLPLNTNLDITLQTPASQFHLDFLGGMTNVYENVTNVVAKLSWTAQQHHDSPSDKGTTGKAFDRDSFSVLVNGHFDSIPGSPGAADDGIGVACMLEALRVLATGPPLDRPVVMLFNGAEEANHQAAHGFITQHQWAKEIKYVLNLEAIGSGGQELVFQCNSGWLAQYYGRHSPHPHFAVIAHELFKLFLYRAASTDWSTLLRYGSPGIRGIDTAYIENGYVYHTSFDTQEIIPDGTFITTGENILKFVRILASDTYGRVPNPVQADSWDENSVFFDVLGFFVVAYVGLKVPILHILALLVGILLVAQLSPSLPNMTLKKWRQLIWNEMYCFFAGLVVPAAYGLVVFWVCPMRWYDGGIGVALWLYTPPVLLTVLHTRGQLTQQPQKSSTTTAATATVGGITTHSTPEARLVAGLLFPWMFFLALAIPFGIMSAYVCGIWICICAFSLGVHSVVKRYTLRYGTPPTHYVFSAEFAYLICMLPVFCYWAEVGRLFFVMMVPLLGKTGTVVPTDPIVGALLGLLVGSPATIVLAFELDRPVLSRRMRWIGFAWMAANLVFASCFMAPYSPTHPKRLWIQHVERDLTLTPTEMLRYGYDHGDYHRLAPMASSSSVSSTSSFSSSLSSSSSSPNAGDTAGMDTATATASNHSHSHSGTHQHTHLPHSGGGFDESRETLPLRDCGLWIHAFDEIGMRPFRQLYGKSFFSTLSKRIFPSSSSSSSSSSVPELDGRYSEAAQCAVDQGDCYLQFPWYFPVSEVLRDSYYIDTECPAVIQSGTKHRLNLQLSSSTLPAPPRSPAVVATVDATATSAVAGSAAATGAASHEETPLKKKTETSQSQPWRLVQVKLSGPSRMHVILRDNAQGTRIKRWFVAEHAEALSAKSTTSTSRSTRSSIHRDPGDNKMAENIQHAHSPLQPPRDEKETETEVKGNGNDEDGDEVDEIVYVNIDSHNAAGDLQHVTYIDPNSRHTSSPSVNNGRSGIPMVKPDPVRSEGVFYVQVVFGLCPGHAAGTTTSTASSSSSSTSSTGATGAATVMATTGVCEKTLYLLVAGEEPIQVAAYAHYTDPGLPETAQLQTLQEVLPAWARGAEWTKFPSMIVSKYV